FYTYRTTFDLTGLNPATAVLNLKWAADDSGVVQLNGAAVPSCAVSGYTTLTGCAISSGFVNGVNTLDFLVTNAGTSPNAIGLRVDASGWAKFYNPSFTATASGDQLTGGGPPAKAYDAGSVKAKINGKTYASA